MAVDLEALDAVLNTTTCALLGDTITYTPAATGVPLTFKAIVDHGDDERLLSNSRATVGDPAVEIPVTVVAEPAGADTVHLPRFGQDFLPKDWRRDKSGMNWLVLLKRKPA